MSAEAKEILYGGRLIPLMEEKVSVNENGETTVSEKLRPISIGDGFAKLAGLAILKIPEVTKELAICLQEADQYGVLVKGGADLIVHALSMGLDHAQAVGMQDWALMAVDYSNAYNTVSRPLIREELVRLGPKLEILLAYFDAMYPLGGGMPLIRVQGEGVVHFVASCTGVQQGNGPAGACFSLGLAVLMREAKSMVPDQAGQVFPPCFVDDANLAGKAGNVIRFFVAMEKAAAKLQSGLGVNYDKTVVLAPGMEEGAVREILCREGALEAATRVRVVKEGGGMRTLGAPIGSSGYAEEFWVDYVQSSTVPLTERIMEMPSFQSRLKLLQFCAGPRANYMLRATAPEVSLRASQLHDRAMYEAVASITEGDLSTKMQAVMRLPFRMGGLGMSEATQLREAAFLAARSSVIQHFAHNRFMMDFMGLQAEVTEAGKDPGLPPEGKVADTAGERGAESAPSAT